MPRPLMSIDTGEQTYINVFEAAANLSIAPSTIYSALTRGNLSTIGKGRGYKPPGNPNYGGGRSKPITLGAHTFPSIAAAARAIGWPPKRLHKVLLNKGPVQSARLYAALLAYDAKQLKLRAKEHHDQPHQ